MSSPSSMFPFTVPLTAANHETAKKFYRQHSNPQKARQVYLNTLSVLAVNFYLSCLGIKTSFEQSQSWNPALQVLSDSADLWVNDFGRLECRTVFPDAKVCVIPAQVWSDSRTETPPERIAYVVVQLNTDLTEADLLGFVGSVETEELPLETLQPIDRLPDYLNSLRAIAPVTILSHWLQNQIAAGWRSLETLLNEQGQPAFSFRAPTILASLNQVTSGAKRGRALTVGTPKIQVLLLVEITPRTTSEYQIKTELYPAGAEAYLPRSLHFAVLDEAGKPVLQAESINSEGFEFQFAGESGEQFSVRISLQEDSIIEAFEI